MKGGRLSRLAPWHVLLLAFTLVLSACASGPGPAPSTAAPPQETLYTRSERFVVVAVANPLQRLPARAATSLPGYGGPPRYTQGEQAARQLQAIARRHQLREAAAWPIPVLGVHCVVFEIAPEATRDQVLAALAADEQVQLAQPLQDFELLAEPADGVRYDDPYLPLQQGFLAMELARAHRYSRGRGVHIAVVDTGAQLDHPDLRGSALRIENLVDSATTPDLAERHGTEVLGLIAAAGNNGRGIVGVAPQARLSLYRACWAVAGGRARCNSFTLARALSAVLSSDARIVNLSLGGPPDPLLALLLEQLIRQGRTVVAAMPPDGQRRGFPAGIAGVLVVAASGQPLPDGALVLQAPGEDVLTLQPGGGYDFASGSSLAAAQVSGLAALLLARQPDLSSATIERLLRASNVGGPAGSEATIGQLIMRGDLTAGARLARQ